MNLPPRAASASRATRASAHARSPDTDSSEAIPSAMSPPCRCCGGTGVSPPLLCARVSSVQRAGGLDS
eukprot:2331872-Prymnesium_polylepis.1